MTNNIETQLIDLIAADRLHVPISSMEGKLKRMKGKIAGGIDPEKGKYSGQRVYARVEVSDKLKARAITQAVADFCTEFPEYGQKLTQMIEDERSVSETHLYFGMKQDCRLTADDYMGVMTSMGFNETQARNLYGPLMDASRTIAKKRAEERSILVG